MALVVAPLREYFADFFYRGTTDESFRLRSITMARSAAAAQMGLPSIRPGSPEAKAVDEAIEAALVRTAQRIIKEADSSQEAYRRLVELYEQQPRLNVRSSTSVAQQAYSTPLPIGYLAATLTGITGDTSVYEPTAGHGSLLLLANAATATVNELNPNRAADLRAQGFTVTEENAVSSLPDRQHEVVIANPPFGTVKNDAGEKERFTVALPKRTFSTTQIDHAIALQSLRAMRDDGRAVLILGGKLGKEAAQRSDRYNTAESRSFYYSLYQNYRVNDHFTIWGDLYKKQGAGFPIDIIVIEGRGVSSRALPAVDVPRIYYSFDELGEHLNDVLQQSERVGTARTSTLASRVVAGERNNNSQRTTLSGIAEPAAELANTVLDGGSGGLDTRGGKDAGQSRDPDTSGIVYAKHNRPGGQRADTAGMATGLGSSDRTQQRQYSTSVGVDRHGLSGERYSPDKGQTRTVASVSTQPKPGAKPGRMADQLDLFGDGVVWQATTEQASDSANEQEQSEQSDTLTKQTPYAPRSVGQSVNTQVPVNMQVAIGQALDRLEDRVGAVDAYVADRLQYGSAEELHGYFSAEQVDALALAINNFENGNGFIIGDQTGIGKGRVVAGLLRYAKVTDRTPLFVTKDPTLYADMIRDLSDIGMKGFNPFVTNRSLPALPLPDGRVLKTGSTTHDKAMQEMQLSGDLGRFDGIFTTYSQMQSVKGRETARREFLRAFAPGSIVVLDESHEAGGDSNQRRKSGAAPNRADFTRELLAEADGALYSSATYAKRPDVMDLYFRTDMQKAVSNMGALAEIVESGGVPMQQALATMLTDAGQYIRRERSFDGVKFTSEVASVNHHTAEQMSVLMGRILNFDTHKQRAVKGMDGDLKAEAKAVAGDSSIGSAGATSTNFTSVMHNLVDQMLLALKAEATVQKSLDLLRQEQSEKPVIALASTMGSFIGQYAEIQEIQPGEALEADFGDLLNRYLERSRDVIIGNPYGEKRRRRLTDAELGPEAVKEYNAIRKAINETDLSDIPISPIDYMTSRLEQEGYNVREITGREHVVHYDEEGDAVYARRSSSERNKATAIKNVAAFNKGNVDILLLNRSGSTGISLHASDKFDDQRRRHMIVVQPERDINLFMQTLGRVHRTGQVVTPNFTLLSADIPAEKRPAAVLSKKMASLNANTTAARSSGVAMDDVPDFMNEYGDRVVAELMQGYPSIHKRLGTPLKGPKHALDRIDAVRKVTGRIPLLPLKEQESLYSLIENEYRELVQNQEAMGESILEAQHLPLDAKPLARMEVEPADDGSTSPFTGPVYLNLVDAKNLRKPYTTLHVINQVRGQLGLPPVKTIAEHDFNAAKEQGKQASSALLEQTMQEVDRYRSYLAQEATTNVRNRQEANLPIQILNVKQDIESFSVGVPVTAIADGMDHQAYGVVSRLWRTGDDQVNPVAPSMWKVKVLLADGVREITVPLSKINTGTDEAIILSPVAEDEQLKAYEQFDELRTHAREQRQIFTGNLLRAYEKFPNAKVVNFTDFQGHVHTGLLTKKDFEIEERLTQQPVKMASVADATSVLTTDSLVGELFTLDQSLAIYAKSNGADAEYVMFTDRSKAKGGKYFLNASVLAATQSDFYSIGTRMECTFPGERLKAVLASLMEDNGWQLAAFTDQDAVRGHLGLSVPKFEEVGIMPETVPAVASAVIEGSTREERNAETAIDLPTEQSENDLHEHTASQEKPDRSIDQPINQPLVEQPAIDKTIYSSDAVSALPGTLSHTLAQQNNKEATAELQGETDLKLPTLNTVVDIQLMDDGKVSPLQVMQQVIDEVDPATGDYLSQKSVYENTIKHPNSVSLDELREWYRAARDLGESIDYLDDIALTGLAAKAELIAEKRRPALPVELYAAMQTTLEQYEPYQERGEQVKNAANNILARVGRKDGKGKVLYSGKIYHLEKSANELTVQKQEGNDTKTILHIINGKMQRTSVLEEDCDRFANFVGKLQMQERKAQLEC